MTSTELRAWREAHNMTRRELAALLGRSVRTVEGWENRSWPPSWVGPILAARDSMAAAEVRLGAVIRTAGRKYTVQEIRADADGAKIHAVAVRGRGRPPKSGDDQ